LYYAENQYILIEHMRRC